MEREQFMDEFIRVLRMRGHNAVSTRYLKSLLLDSRFGELEACTTDVCMSQIIKLVGARFLIHGSLDYDTSSACVVKLTIIDVPFNRQLIEKKTSFAKKTGMSVPQIVEFADSILSNVSMMLSAITGVISVVDVQSKDSSIMEPVEITEPSAGKKDDLSDSAGRFCGPTEVTENLIIDSLTEQAPEVASDTSLAYDMSDTTDTATDNDTVNTFVSSSDEADSTKHVDTVMQVNTISTSVPLSLSAPQDYKLSGPAAPPEALQRENTRKKFKILRISTCGISALAAFTGGMVINSSVRKSLDKEKMLFNDYMRADKNQTENRYQVYLSQTEKTDVKVQQRSFLYVLGLLGLTGCAISIKF
jgi:hypothetical protein